MNPRISQKSFIRNESIAITVPFWVKLVDSTVTFTLSMALKQGLISVEMAMDHQLMSRCSQCFIHLLNIYDFYMKTAISLILYLLMIWIIFSHIPMTQRIKEEIPLWIIRWITVCFAMKLEGKRRHCVRRMILHRG